MTKILLGIIAALTLGLIVSGFVLKHEMTKVGGLEASYKTSQADVKQLNKELLQKTELDKVTDSVVEAVGKTKLQTETKIDEIQRTVKSTSKKEAKGEISPATASSVYIDSMWRAYCEAGIPNPHCSSK